LVVSTDGGQLDHLLGNSGEFDEVGTTLVDGSNDVLGLIKDVNGVLVFLGSSVGEALLLVSHGVDNGQVLGVGEGLLYVDLKLVVGSDLLVLTGTELGG